MAGRHQNRSFPLPGIHSSAQVHAFGNCTDSDMLEEDAEVYELRSRGKEKIRRSTSKDRLDDIIVLTKDIQEGDTLNAIALQYCCTVSFHLTLHNAAPNTSFVHSTSWSKVCALSSSFLHPLFFFLFPQKSLILLVDVNFLNFKWTLEFCLFLSHDSVFRLKTLKCIYFSPY